MKRRLYDHLYSLAICLLSMLYAWSIIYIPSSIHILEYPERLYLAVLMVIFSIAKIIAFMRGWNRLRGVFLLFISLCWLMVTYIYVVTDIDNRAWTMSGFITVICYITLLKGRFEGCHGKQ